jgi:large subunit ribosomal protein L15
MTLTLHTLPRVRRRRHRRVGRGNASGRGTYAGRGQKGQRARSGGRKGLQQRALRQLFQRLPKVGGFRSLKPKAAVVSVAELQRHCRAGELVTPRLLVQKGLVPRGVPAKVLGPGPVDRPLHLKGCQASASAREAIVAAGGSVG